VTESLNNTPLEIELADEELMSPFVLQFKGPLHSSQGSDGGRIKREKHNVRRAFHEQLKARWFKIRKLERLARSGWVVPERGAKRVLPDGTIATYDWNWAFTQRRNIRFIPLVIRAQSISLVAELDIRMYWRQNDQGGILQPTDGGIDLDNRLKGLLDALTIPQENQLPDDDLSNDPNPFLCLLENDNLVTRLQIKAAPLPFPTPKDEQSGYAEISIDVSVIGGDLTDDL
jgi:hypothetical protein